MPFRVSFSPTRRAWIASVEDSPTLSWAAASPLEALAGVMALTPAPDGISDDTEDRDGRERYDEYVRELIISGAARGCACSKPGCHCDGIADNAPLGYDTCGCCTVDCPDVHDPEDDAPAIRIRQQMAADPLPEQQMAEVPGCSRCVWGFWGCLSGRWARRCRSGAGQGAARLGDSMGVWGRAGVRRLGLPEWVVPVEAASCDRSTLATRTGVAEPRSRRRQAARRVSTDPCSSGHATRRETSAS